MKRLGTISRFVLAVALLAGACATSAQQSFYQRFRANNASMTAVQPLWIGPLTQTDARLGQVVRVSVSNKHEPMWAIGGQAITYGNNQGVSVIVDRRFQLNFVPPSFFRNHTVALKDGFGNAGAEIKYRIVSGNAEHGNYILTADLTYGFAPRAYENGRATSLYSPKLAAGMAFGRFDVQSSVGGSLPTGKIAQQGRSVEWDVTAQAHLNKNLWFDVENGTTFNIGGTFDGTTQNFVTPVAYYAMRKDWSPTHTSVIFGAGMQIATTKFHFYNHNLTIDMRVSF